MAENKGRTPVRGLRAPEALQTVTGAPGVYSGLRPIRETGLAGLAKDLQHVSDTAQRTTPMISEIKDSSYVHAAKALEKNPELSDPEVLEKAGLNSWWNPWLREGLKHARGDVAATRWSGPLSEQLNEFANTEGATLEQADALINQLTQKHLEEFPNADEAFLDGFYANQTEVRDDLLKTFQSQRMANEEYEAISMLGTVVVSGFEALLDGTKSADDLVMDVSTQMGFDDYLKLSEEQRLDSAVVRIISNIKENEYNHDDLDKLEEALLKTPMMPFANHPTAGGRIKAAIDAADSRYDAASYTKGLSDAQMRATKYAEGRLKMNKSLRRNEDITQGELADELIEAGIDADVLYEKWAAHLTNRAGPLAAPEDIKGWSADIRSGDLNADGIDDLPIREDERAQLHLLYLDVKDRNPVLSHPIVRQTLSNVYAEADIIFSPDTGDFQQGGAKMTPFLRRHLSYAAENFDYRMLDYVEDDSRIRVDEKRMREAASEASLQFRNDVQKGLILDKERKEKTASKRKQDSDEAAAALADDTADVSLTDLERDARYLLSITDPDELGEELEYYETIAQHGTSRLARKEAAFLAEQAGVLSNVPEDAAGVGQVLEGLDAASKQLSHTRGIFSDVHATNQPGRPNRRSAYHALTGMKKELERLEEHKVLLQKRKAVLEAEERSASLLHNSELGPYSELSEGEALILWDVDVTEVLDGDTIMVETDYGLEEIRFSGFDTPESHQVFGPESTKALEGLFESGRVQVAARKRGPYGRMVADVFIDGEPVMDKMLAQGMAHVYSRYNDSPSDHLTQARAQEAGAGLWGLPRDQQQTPSNFRRDSRNSDINR